MSPGSAAETRYGRRGGGWAGKPSNAPRGWKVHYRTEGGPLAGEVPVYTWGRTPGAPPDEIPITGVGVYRFDGHAYRWLPAGNTRPEFNPDQKETRP